MNLRKASGRQRLQSLNSKGRSMKFNAEQREALKELFPPEERDALTTFVIDNSVVYQAVQFLLEDEAEAGDWLSSTLPANEVALVGGSQQAQVLKDIARENGLQFRPDGLGGAYVKTHHRMLHVHFGE